MDFGDFVPKGYTNLLVYDKLKRKKITIPVNSLSCIFSLEKDKTALVYAEKNTRRMAIVSHSLNEVLKFFSEGKIEQ